MGKVFHAQFKALARFRSHPDGFAWPGCYSPPGGCGGGTFPNRMKR